MSLQVRGSRVLVAPERQDVYERPDGLVTVEAYAPEVMGRVVAVGDVTEVAIGDVVVFAPSAGQVMDYDQQRYLVLDESDVLAVMEMTE